MMIQLKHLNVKFIISKQEQNYLCIFSVELDKSDYKEILGRSLALQVCSITLLHLYLVFITLILHFVCGFLTHRNVTFYMANGHWQLYINYRFSCFPLLNSIHNFHWKPPPLCCVEVGYGYVICQENQDCLAVNGCRWIQELIWCSSLYIILRIQP